MALEHALLVSLRERPAAGSDLARRFDRSIGFFWPATHQQIYRTLARMTDDGWLDVTSHAQSGAPAKKVYAVSATGERVLSQWLATSTSEPPARSALSVRMRGASFADDPEAVLSVVRGELLDHRARLDHYLALTARDYPDPDSLTGLALDQYLVLRGGVRLEEFWVGWLTEYLDAHDRAPHPAHPTAAPLEGDPR